MSFKDTSSKVECDNCGKVEWCEATLVGNESLLLCDNCQDKYFNSKEKLQNNQECLCCKGTCDCEYGCSHNHENQTPQTKPTDEEIEQPISSNLINPALKMDKTADNSPKSAGDDTLTSVRTTAKGIVRSKASIPNGAICEPETLSDTRIHTVEVDWGQMQNYVKIEDIEKLIERYEHDYRYTQAALLKDLKALVENKEKTA